MIKRNLSCNYFEGPIPESIGNLTGLENLLEYIYIYFDFDFDN